MKIINGWTNMFINEVSQLPLMENAIYLTQEFALERRCEGVTYIGKPVYISHEFEDMIDD